MPEAIIIPNWFKESIKFTGKWTENTEIELLSFNPITNLCKVRLVPDKTSQPWRQDCIEDKWNLQHILWGFEQGIYKLIQ